MQELLERQQVALGQGWGLQRSGRFSHSRDGIEGWLESAGFATVAIYERNIRKTGKRMQQGYEVVARLAV